MNPYLAVGGIALAAVLTFVGIKLFDRLRRRDAETRSPGDH